MVKAPRFDARWQRRRRRAVRWRAWWKTGRWWLGLALLLALGWGLAQLPVTGGEWERVETRFTICGERGARGCVVDGDTIMLGQRRIRLTGYDAPELDGACEAERRLALQARAGLHAWLARGPFLLDGGTDAPRDRYGRELRAARRDDAAGQQWLADTMVEQGLGRDTGWGAPARDWCDRA